MLKIPDFSKVFEWRELQEQKLKALLTDEENKDNQTMSESELNRFIMHYERITRHTLQEMPTRADVVFSLGDDHKVKAIKVKEGI